jgi:hypothetical protein
MVAAQNYNQLKNRKISAIYGCVTSGMLWQLESSEVTDQVVRVVNDRVGVWSLVYVGLFFAKTI